MKALTMADALEVCVSRTGSKYALSCIEALSNDPTAVAKNRRVWDSDVEQYGMVGHSISNLASPTLFGILIGPRLAKLAGSKPAGRLVIECLRAYADGGLPSVYTWAEYPLAKSSPAAKSKAAELYADCWLVFAEFVASWNRRQIRVAS